MNNKTKILKKSYLINLAMSPIISLLLLLPILFTGCGPLWDLDEIREEAKRQKIN